MIIKEKVSPNHYTERGGGDNLLNFPQELHRWKGIMVGLAVTDPYSITQRGGSQELIIILQGTKVGGDYGLNSQIDYSSPLHSE